MLQKVAGVGALALTAPLRHVLAKPVLPPTPEQTRGPFYPVMRPLEDDADLTTLNGATGRAQGQVIHLVGRVLNPSGQPIRGAKIEIWQANTHGRYDHPGDINQAPLDPNFQGFARQVTNEQGQYRFKTIKPGAYPINPVNPGAIRPPHIHFDVTGTEDHLITQMYFPGEPLNDGDFIYSKLGANKAGAIARLLAPTDDIATGEILLGWDIILEKG